MPFQKCVRNLLGFCILFPAVYGCCKNGWIRYDDSCYLIENEKLDWYSAKNMCSIVGGHLAEPQTERENNFLRQSLKKIFPAGAPGTSSTYFWIDGNDVAVENDWVWQNGQSISYTDWAPGEPSNARAGNCLMYHGGEDFHWNDADCIYYKSRYICEMETEIDEVVG